jgi:hypothetical protein
MSVSGRTGLMIILAAAALGFFIALAGSPGIGSVSAAEDEVVYVSVVAVNQAADESQ